jgi:hypothetical protein
MNPEPVPDDELELTEIETTTGRTVRAIPAIESSGRGEVSPPSVGNVIGEFGWKLIKLAPIKPAVPASKPLITPASTAVLIKDGLRSDLLDEIGRVFSVLE